MKLLVSVSVLRLSGNLFHKIGAADAKARSPYVQVDDLVSSITTYEVQCSIHFSPQNIRKPTDVILE